MSAKNKTIGIVYLGVAGFAGFIGGTNFLFRAMDDTSTESDIRKALILTIAATGVPLYFGVKRLMA
jgi:hypothetical protein